MKTLHRSAARSKRQALQKFWRPALADAGLQGVEGMTPEQQTEWDSWLPVARISPMTGRCAVRSDVVLAIDAELKRLRDDLAAEKLFSAQATKAVEEIAAQRDRLLEALKAMIKTEPCDCGCPQKQKTVVLKPAHYVAIARDAITKVEGAA